MNFINRRKFLAVTGSLTILSGASMPLRASNATKKLGVALVGLGRYSEFQLGPALLMTEHCELRGIVTGSPHKIPAWKSKYKLEDKNVYNYGNMHEIADNPDIDVVYIVLPTSMHKEYTIIAANAGKHVWCEKPMAMTTQDCQEMIDACARNKVSLSIGYRLQHEPNTQTIIEYANHKPYGKIETVVARAGYKGGPPPKGNWRLQRAMGGGATYDMGVYPINAARYTTGEEPIAVTATHKVYRPEVFKEVAEATFFELEFPSGAIAKCATSVYESMNILRADCTEGWYKLEPFQSYSGVRGETSDGKKLDQKVNDQQARQMDNDALAIINKTPPIVPGKEGLNDIKVVQAILTSAQENGKRVSI